jgi:uncharacterized protein involved in exopolysaccharide biosynthesis
MRAQPSPTPDDIDLKSLAAAVRRALPKVLLGSLLVGAMTSGAMLTMLPKYSAQTVLQAVSTNPESLSTEKTDAAAVATHVAALKSTDLQQKMSQEFKLAARPEFNNALPATDTFTRALQLVGLDKPKPGQSDEERVRQAYYSALKVGQGRETRAINVEFTSSDPKLSAAAANTLAKLYRESLTNRTLVANNQEAERLKPQVERVRQELATAEQTVTKYRAESDQFATSGGAQAPSTQSAQQLGELTAEATRAATARQEAEARARTAREQIAAGNAEANPDVQKSQLIPRLVEQRSRIERQVSELSATLLPAHPRMRQVQSDLAALNRQIMDEVRKVVDSIERDAKIAKDKEDGILKRIALAKSTSVSKAPQEAQLKALEEAAKNKRSELERIERSYNEALSKGSAPTTRVGVEIIQEAIPSLEKVFPKPGFFGPMLALAALLVGMAWTVTREIVSSSRPAQTAAREAPRQLDAIHAANDPRPASPRTQPAAPPARSGASAATASAASPPKPDLSGIAAVAANLLDRTNGQPGFRSLIAGDTSAIDAAAEAIALAKALSKTGKQVALVDWTIGANTLADQVGAAREPGLAQLIDGQVAFEDVIQRLADSETHFIPAGDSAVDSKLIFDPDRANLVLDALDEAYDHIIVYGSHDQARDLFQAIQGRFDVGIAVVEPRRNAPPATGFLGFDVADMDIFRVERPVSSPHSQTRRQVLAHSSAATSARA